MSIKKFVATTPSLRFLKQVNYLNVFLKKKKIKQQCFGIHRCFGRNNSGRITSYHKGGGCKRVYRRITRSFSEFSIVEGLEYDPFRTAFLMRVFDIKTKSLHYQIAPQGIKRGDVLRFTYSNFKPKIGHSTFLSKLPLGSNIYNINFSVNNLLKSASVSAGTCSRIIQKTDKHCVIRLSSGHLRYFPLNAIGCFGKVSNKDHRLICIGKAGRSRWLNRRPIVRGVAMNPIDHPHGGGQGKTSAGRPSVSPWGKLTKGVKTRSLKRRFSCEFKKKRKN